MSAQDEIQLRERMLAFAVQASPDRAADVAGEFLAFVKAEFCDRNSQPEDRSQIGRVAG